MTFYQDIECAIFVIYDNNIDSCSHGYNMVEVFIWF